MTAPAFDREVDVLVAGAGAGGMASAELHDLLQVRWGGGRGKRMLAILATGILRSRLFGLRMTSTGQSLSTRLYLSLRDRGVPVWWETPLTSLVTDDDGRVAGAE